MKISRLLVLSALWLLGQSAWAADLIERTAPETPEVMPIFGDGGVAVEGINRTPAAFELEKIFVLYNTGAQKFFTQGNNWGTRASVGDVPLAVRFTLPDGKTQADQALILNDYDIKNKAWKVAFFDSETSMFVDRGTQANFYWNVIDQGNNTYRLQASPLNPDLNPTTHTGFVGRDETVAIDLTNNGGVNVEAEPLSPFVAEGAGHIDWQLFRVTDFPEWEAYFAAKVIYDKSQQLKAQIEKAEGLGVDVSAAVAVYNNEAATVAEMQAAIDQLQAAMTGGIGSGTPDNPSDATTLINNPDFDNASAAGWAGTTPNMTGSGSHGPANVPEHYNKTFDTYQDITGMPAGVYGLSANTCFRGSWDDHANKANYVAFLYATIGGQTVENTFDNMWDAMNTTALGGATEWGVNASESTEQHDGVSYYIPNDPSAARVYFEHGYYKNALVFNVTDGSARIGVKKSEKVTDTDWAIFDTFRLTYYGNEPASYGAWLADNAKGLYPEEIDCTKSYIDEYLAEIESAKASATDQASAMATLETLKNSQALANLKENVILWGRLVAKIADARQDVGSGDTCAETLADYLDIELEDALEGEKTMTNEEILAAIARIDELVAEMKECMKGHFKDGDDATGLLTNPGFEKNGGSIEGWTVVSAGGGNVQLGGNANNHCYEAWHSTNFEVYQEVIGAPVGVYEISVQGYVRYLDGQDAITNKDNRPEDIPIYVYLNSAKSNLPNWFDSQRDEAFYQNVSGASYLTDSNTGYAYPDNMTAASAAFAEGDYTKTAMALVKEGETMRIGVKGTPSQAQFWPIFDNFKLTYRGFNADAVRPALEEALQSIALDQPMGKSVYEKAAALQAEADEAMASGDGTKMFNVLGKVYDLSDEITESVALFKNLSNKLEDFMQAIGQSTNMVAQAEAQVLYETILNNIDARQYENEDVPGLLEQIKAMETRLKMPDVTEASDVNPIDVTDVVSTPNFEKEGTNSIDGWENTTGYNFGNDESQRSALLLEFYDKDFNIYQDIFGLPNGTYEVSVKAFKRGQQAHDIAFPMEADGAWLYAKSGDATASKLLPTIFAGATTEDYGIGGGTATDEATGTVYYLPNDMLSASAFFELSLNYTVSAIIKVNDGKLRIGIEQDNHLSGDWVIFDDFKLVYYGTESTKEQTGDGIESVENAAQQTAEFFTVDGRRANAAQKGLIIVKKGNTVVKKIQK